MSRRRHWHAIEWFDGSLGRKLANFRVEDEGLHGDLVERNGAFAYPLDVPGDERRWVCHWVCELPDVR